MFLSFNQKLFKQNCITKLRQIRGIETLNKENNISQLQHINVTMKPPYLFT